MASTLEPGDIVELGNFAVQKNVVTRKAIETTRPVVWDLPPQSPDLDPIENMSSKIKALL